MGNLFCNSSDSSCGCGSNSMMMILLLLFLCGGGNFLGGCGDGSSCGCGDGMSGILPILCLCGGSF